MGLDLANLGIKINYQDVDKANKELDQLTNKSARAERATEKLSNSFKSMKSNVLGVKTAIASLITMVTGSLLVKSFLEASKATESYETRLKILLGSQREGAKLFRDMADYATRVPHAYQEVMSSATALAGVMKGGVDEINEWMPMIGDLAVAAGLSLEDTTGQVIRMYSAGAGAADLFREKGVLAMMGFKAGATYSVAETRKRMMEEWTKANSQFRGATDEMAVTWDGIMGMIGDKWFQLRNKVMDSGVFEFMKDQLKAVDEAFGAWLDNSDEDINNLVDNTFPMFITVIAGLVQWIKGLTVAWNAWDLAVSSTVKNINRLGRFEAKLRVGALEKALDAPFNPLKGFTKKRLEEAKAELAEWEGYVAHSERRGEELLNRLGRSIDSLLETQDLGANLKKKFEEIRKTIQEEREKTGNEIKSGVKTTRVLPNPDDEPYEAEATKKLTVGEARFYRDEFAKVYKEIALYEYEVKLEALEKKAELYKKAGADELAVAKWVEQERAKYEEQAQRHQEAKAKVAEITTEYRFIGYSEAQKEIAMLREEAERLKTTLWEAGELTADTEKIIDVAYEKRISDIAVEEAKRKQNELTESARNYSEMMKDTMAATRDEFTNTLNDMVWGAEFSFSKIAESFGRMMTRMIIQKEVAEPFMGWFGSVIGIKSAHGNVFSGGKVIPFAKGGVLGGPTMFPLGLAGEEGPEAIMPLKRLPGGNLGVQASGAGTKVEVNVINNVSNAEARVEERTTANGDKQLDVIIDEIIAQKVVRGKTHTALKNTFNLSPALTRR